VAATVVRVDLAERAYEIAIGPGVLASCGAALGSAGARRVVIIADTGVLATHADTVVSSLRHAGIATMTIPVQRGEGSKSVTEADRLWEEFVSNLNLKIQAT
jgi:3-dehydroquinate synthase